MTGEHGVPAERAFPRFFTEWRGAFGDGAADFVPLDYLNQDEAVPFVLAAQWLFCPVFTEYEGCVVVVKGGTDDGELSDADRGAIDAWRARFPDDPAEVEFKVNLLQVPGVFSSAELGPYEEDLAALARTVARCWDALLRVRFPDRSFTVEVFDDPGSPTDPQLTFYSGGSRDRLG